MGVIRLASFPAAEKDADPFVSQGADCGVMFFASSTLVIIEGPGPVTEADGVIGKLVEGLA